MSLDTSQSPLHRGGSPDKAEQMVCPLLRRLNPLFIGVGLRTTRPCAPAATTLRLNPLFIGVGLRTGLEGVSILS